MFFTEHQRESHKFNMRSTLAKNHMISPFFFADQHFEQTGRPIKTRVKVRVHCWKYGKAELILLTVY